MARTPDSASKTAECFEFTWRRRQKGPGFRWEWNQRVGSVLVGPPDEDLQAYEPLVVETGLFLTFAHLDGSDDGFLRFANAYGRLGTYHRYAPEGGEPLEEWQWHHRWMQFLADLHNCLNDRLKLGHVVSWKGDDVIYRFPKIGTASTESWRHIGQLRQCPQSMKGLLFFQPGDLHAAALWFLGYALNDWLIELQGWHTPIAPRLVWSEEHRRPQFVFRPSSLLGAMVCQFAAALHGAWPFKECAYCHKFFRLAPGVNRANRLTCSRTCKQYLHNRRVERARELYAEGRAVRQIIKDLNVRAHGKKSSADIVRAWLGRPPLGHR